MSTTSVTALVTGAIADFGTSALAVLTAVIGIGLAFLVFRWGWKKVKGSMH